MSWETVKIMYVTYHSVLVVGTRRTLVNTGNDGVGIQNKLSLKRESQWRPGGDTLNVHRRHRGSSSGPISIPQSHICRTTESKGPPCVV